MSCTPLRNGNLNFPINIISVTEGLTSLLPFRCVPWTPPAFPKMPEQISPPFTHSQGDLAIFHQELGPKSAHCTVCPPPKITPSSAIHQCFPIHSVLLKNELGSKVPVPDGDIKGSWSPLPLNTPNLQLHLEPLPLKNTDTWMGSSSVLAMEGGHPRGREWVRLGHNLPIKLSPSTGTTPESDSGEEIQNPKLCPEREGFEPHTQYSNS